MRPDRAAAGFRMPAYRVAATTAAAAALLAAQSSAGAVNALTTAGRDIAGPGVTARCATPTEDRQLRSVYALAETTGQKIVLSQQICRLIANETKARAFAVAVYAHELGHAHLHTKVECLAQRYGVTHWRALWTLLVPSEAPTAAQLRYLAQRNYVYPFKTCAPHGATT